MYACLRFTSNISFLFIQFAVLSADAIDSLLGFMKKNDSKTRYPHTLNFFSFSKTMSNILKTLF